MLILWAKFCWVWRFLKCSANSCFRHCSRVQKNTGSFLLKLWFEGSWQADWNTSLDQADRWRSGSLELIWIKHLALQWRQFHGTFISHTIIHGALMFPCETQTARWPGEVVGTAILFTDTWSYFCLAVFGGKVFFIAWSWEVCVGFFQLI